MPHFKQELLARRSRDAASKTQPARRQGGLLRAGRSFRASQVEALVGLLRHMQKQANTKARKAQLEDSYRPRPTLELSCAFKSGRGRRLPFSVTLPRVQR
jgi:hypothetical protein